MMTVTTPDDIEAFFESDIAALRRRLSHAGDRQQSLAALVVVLLLLDMEPVDRERLLSRLHGGVDREGRVTS